MAIIVTVVWEPRLMDCLNLFAFEANKLYTTQLYWAH